MSKLPDNHQFFDLSDYGRSMAKKLVALLLPTGVGSLTLTALFGCVGIAAAYLIYIREFLGVAGVLLVLKSVIDAADGEMARARNRPSYTGRYADSILDFILNGCILAAIGIPLGYSLGLIGLIWLCFQLHGTVYNYNYVMRRHYVQGDTTSRIIEIQSPKPYAYEHAGVVWILHKVYLIVYGWQDLIVYGLDRYLMRAHHRVASNAWMTALSVCGLGSQLFVIAVCVVTRQFDWVSLIVLIGYNAWVGVLLLIRGLRL
ncbi:CDP-alcohol phosphatidyltransferase [bacterium]|jgi:hypothetical protein|nr:CDP-alcohol phosphatidyltransferase [bacterium]|tara:strand:- start:17698 stop:18474 length:777 start_codon:yes stop_codon:yes gene_type:complete